MASPVTVQMALRVISVKLDKYSREAAHPFPVKMEAPAL